MYCEVIRPPGDKRGPNIVDPMLVTEEIGRARGVGAIDYYFSNRYVDRGNCILMDWMLNGLLLNVTDSSGSFRGKLTGFSIIIDIDLEGKEFTCTSAITIEKEMK